MKKVLFIFASLLFAINLHSQTCQWANKIEVSGNSAEGFRTTCDKFGNVFVSGTFSGDSLSFSNAKKVQGHGISNGDGYLAKYDSTGICLWAVSFGGTSSELFSGLAVDNSGNIYVSGMFKSRKLDFNNNVSLDNTDAGSYGYVAKYNADGLCQWAKKICDTPIEIISNLAVDKKNNIIIFGGYSSIVLEFQSGIEISNRGVLDCFLAKLDSSGNYMWAKDIGGLKSDFPIGMCVDNSNNILISGIFASSKIIFSDSIKISKNSAATYDAFVVKYDSNGLCKWANGISGDKYKYAQSVSPDAAGNIYIAGYYTGSDLIFNNGVSLTNNEANNYNDSYLAMFDSSGLCQWAKSIHGNNSNTINSISADPSGNFIISGYFQSDSLSFANSKFILQNSNLDSMQAYFALFQSDGTCVSAQKLLGSNNDNAESCLLEASGDFYISGYFNSPSLEFNNGKILNSSNAKENAFIAKYSSAPLSVVDSKENGVDVQIRPNPVSDYLELSVGNTNEPIEKVIIYDELGNLVFVSEQNDGANKLNVSKLSQGWYRIVVKTKYQSFSKSFSIIR